MKEAFSCEATLTVPLCAAISGESQVQSEHSLYLRDVLRQQLRANGSSLLHLPQHGPGPKGSNVVFQFMCVQCNHYPLPGAGPFQDGMVIHGHTLPSFPLQGFSSTCFIRPGISQDPLQSHDLITAYHLTSKHLGIPANRRADSLGSSASVK